MPQSWMVVVHIKAYSFKLHIFKEGFWILLVKNSLVQKYPQKLGLEGTSRLRLYKKHGHDLFFCPEGKYHGAVEYFPPECDGLVPSGCWGQSLEIRSLGQ